MMKNQIDAQAFFTFYVLAEKLKVTLRHSWLSDGKRQESVAEHTWMMALLSLVLAPQISPKLDITKILKMIIIHDLAEAVTSDIPIWDGLVQKDKKYLLEKEAIKKILSHVPKKISIELLEVWEEYEARATKEAQFVKVLDTLDVIVQHNVSPTETWNEKDYYWQLSPIQDKFFNFDALFRELKMAIDRWSIEKATAAGGRKKLDQSELLKRINNV